MRLNAVVVGLGVLIAAATLTADNPKFIPWEETGGFKRVDDSPRYRAAAQRLIHHRNRFRIASASSAASADVGDVAVVADNGAIINPPRDANAFDLPLSTGLVWTPVGAGFAVAFTPTPFQPPAGPALSLSDDDTENVTLPFAFSFLGTSYTSIFVNSDGNITLGEGDAQSAPRDAPRLIGGPPRIAPLLRDLNPEAGGSIRADVLADHVVVTWTDVPEFGTTNANTFQVTLQSNGAITFVYQRVDNPESEMVVGVAEGNSEGPIAEIDFTVNLPATFGAGAIFEEFGPAHGTEVDIAQLSNEFFRTHADVYDYLVVFTDFDVDLRGAFAFNAGVRNDTQGLGTPLLRPLGGLWQRGRARIVRDDERHRSVLAGRGEARGPADPDVSVFWRRPQLPVSTWARSVFAARTAVRHLQRIGVLYVRYRTPQCRSSLRRPVIAGSPLSHSFIRQPASGPTVSISWAGTWRTGASSSMSAFRRHSSAATCAHRRWKATRLSTSAATCSATA